LFRLTRIWSACHGCLLRSNETKAGGERQDTPSAQQATASTGNHPRPTLVQAKTVNPPYRASAKSPDGQTGSWPPHGRRFAASVTEDPGRNAPSPATVPVTVQAIIGAVCRNWSGWQPPTPPLPIRASVPARHPDVRPVPPYRPSAGKPGKGRLSNGPWFRKPSSCRPDPVRSKRAVDYVVVAA
jgi:hypothetical protein